MGYTAAIAALFSLLFITSQRIVQRHQRLFRGFVVFLVIIVFLRGSHLREHVTGLLIALIVSYLFWLLIGRYNRVGNADDENIKVYGMDD